MLVIGMSTVFFILLFVVGGGKILIRLVNRFYPIDEAKIAISDSSGDNRKIAAVIAAVDVVTAGKGKVSSIRKSIR